jgi:hypothetical protein
MKRIAVVGFYALLITSCAIGPQFKQIGPERQTVGSAYSLDPQIAWSRAAAGKFELWTVDGPGLDEISFANGIANGEAIVMPAPLLAERPPLPLFREGMTPSEIAELITDTLASIGFIDVEAHNLRPFDFGGRPGFQFELTMLTPTSLEQRGLVAGMLKDERLYLITFRAASDYYYPKYETVVQRMLESITSV